jgi:dihydropteroate synthase
MPDPGPPGPVAVDGGAIRPAVAPVLALGERRFDLSTRALVMGILNRTPDSFYDQGATFELDAFFRRAEALMEAGADILDVGGVKAGPGPEVTEAEEMDRVISALEALCERFNVAVSVDTWRASVAREAYAVGAVLGNDISGFADPEYLEVAARAGASVVATHIRLAPRVRDAEPHYDDVVAAVGAFLTERAERALAAGIVAERIVLDAGLDLGKTAQQSLTLLRGSGDLAALGYPLLLSASNKTFLSLFGLDLHQRREASLAAAALGVTLGCRVLRVHDVAGTVLVRDALAAVGAAW